MRGTAMRTQSSTWWRGITPACAGNSSPIHRNLELTRDHPRVCGEQRQCAYIKGKVKGSPPRVRGTEWLSKLAVHVHRITPACAGNSMPRWVKSSMAGDHPRVCGEQITPGAPAPPGEGSPPRVRGTDPFPNLTAIRWGITPACAGNRCFRAALWVNN